MNAKEFVSIFKKEKDIMLRSYLTMPDTKVNKLINNLKLNGEQKQVMEEIIDLLLTDTFYTVLMGLDGEANIGGIQQTYKIYDENSNLISSCGDIEAAMGILTGEEI